MEISSYRVKDGIGMVIHQNPKIGEIYQLYSISYATAARDFFCERKENYILLQNVLFMITKNFFHEEYYYGMNCISLPNLEKFSFLLAKNTNFFTFFKKASI